MKIGKTCFWMSKDTHSKNTLGSSLPLKFKRTEKTSSCPDNCRSTGRVHVKNTSGLRRLKPSLVNTVNLKRKLLVCRFTATDFSLRRSEVDQ